MLKFYASRFDIVELNNSFYKLPSEKALAAWRDSSPAGFCFAMKGSRFLTHMKKLSDTGRGVERFFERAGVLGSKLGPVVFQLPPHWNVNAARLRDFLAALPRGGRYAFEFRNETWNRAEVFTVLRRANAAYCIFDLAGYQSPLEVTADFVYVRLHGPDGPYQGSYGRAALRAWIRLLREWNCAAYVFFDNDQAGYAAQNALALQQMLAEC